MPGKTDREIEALQVWCPANNRMIVRRDIIGPANVTLYFSAAARGQALSERLVYARQMCGMVSGRCVTNRIHDLRHGAGISDRQHMAAEVGPEYKVGVAVGNAAADVRCPRRLHQIGHVETPPFYRHVNPDRR